MIIVMITVIVIDMTFVKTIATTIMPLTKYDKKKRREK